MFATRARKNVEKARLTLDAAKARAKGSTWKLPVPAVAAAQQQSSPRAETHDEEISPEAQEEIEKAEDEFVTSTEEAVGVMKNVSTAEWGDGRHSLHPARLLTSRAQVLDTPEPLRNLAELISAQMEYHKKAYEILSELAPTIEGLQVEQEASRASAYSLP